MAKSIYELELHESTEIFVHLSMAVTEITKVTRVPGGWIYRIGTKDLGNANSIKVQGVIFVPYSKEFKPESNEDNSPTIEN